MFNRHRFNRTPFNRSKRQSIFFDDINISLKINTSKIGETIILTGFVARINLGLSVYTKLNKSAGLQGSSHIQLNKKAGNILSRTFSSSPHINTSTAAYLNKSASLQAILDMFLDNSVPGINRGRIFSANLPINIMTDSHINKAVNLQSILHIILSTDSYINKSANLQSILHIILNTDVYLNKVANLQSILHIILNTDGYINNTASLQASLDILLDNNITDMYRGRAFSANMDLNLYLHSILSIFRISHINLPTIILRPTDELVIDTDNLTVRLNGQNSLLHLDRLSEFFMLMLNENEITIQGTQGRALIKTIHHDMWL